MNRREWRGFDRLFFLATVALLGIGLLALYSAAFQKSQMMGVSFLNRQMTWAILGCALAVVLVVIDYHRWLEWAYLLYGFNLFLLLLVLVIGTTRGGAQRWLMIGGLTIQPSEFAKITTVLAVARFLGEHKDIPGERFRPLIGTLVLIGMPMSLVLMQPNLGTASVFFVMALAMLVVWGLPVRWVAAALLLLACLAPMGWFFIEGYQKSRLMVFMNPNLDPLGAGYTVIQSRIAMGSGFWTGKGWMSGTQNQLNFLPERHTDFIFSIIGEEWGFFGTTVCFALFLFLFSRGLRMAEQTRDPYGRLLIVGLVTMLAYHTVVNVGMVLGMMPVVGLPLPFMSYGGSWMMTCLVSCGIILSVGVRRPVF